ncbi:hypothetical protein JTB14_011148 [Gonioctena quinquepunctata]|nr:hypothetical protein JTB14_011148 [Gonioctena quinquepunctata]
MRNMNLTIPQKGKNPKVKKQKYCRSSPKVLSEEQSCIKNMHRINTINHEMKTEVNKKLEENMKTLQQAYTTINEREYVPLQQILYATNEAAKEV